MVSRFCARFFHIHWKCRCIICGHTLDNWHNWNGCTCRSCGLVREHEWDGCKCRSCGLMREHEWDGCKCQVCGETRDLTHQWLGQCIVTCSKCNKKIQKQEHQWDNDTCLGQCTLCGVRNDSGRHNWDNDTCMGHCTLCGVRNYHGTHDWYEVVVGEEIVSAGTNYDNIMYVTTSRCARCGEEGGTSYR